MSRFVLVVVGMLLCIGAAGCNRITYGFEVEAGESLALGGQGNGAFTATVRTDGPATVSVVEARSNGDRESVGLVTAGQPLRHRFRPRSAAVFINDSQTAAPLAIALTGDTGLSLPYTPERRE